MEAYQKGQVSESGISWVWYLLKETRNSRRKGVGANHNPYEPATGVPMGHGHMSDLQGKSVYKGAVNPEAGVVEEPGVVRRWMRSN